MLQYTGLWLLIVLSFNMWAWISVMHSGARLTVRGIWTVVLLCLPGIGFVAWFLIGPRDATV